MNHLVYTNPWEDPPRHVCFTAMWTQGANGGRWVWRWEYTFIVDPARFWSEPRTRRPPDAWPLPPNWQVIPVLTRNPNRGCR